MSYTFLPGSTLSIDIDGSGYAINPESFTVSQTFQETNFSLKTLQDRTMIEESLVQKIATGSFNFSYYLSDVHTDDGFIWEWFGLTKSSSRYNINSVMADAPIMGTIYLNTLDGKKVKVENAVIETLDLEFGPDTITKVSLSGSASLISTIDSFTLSTATKTGTYLGAHPVIITEGATDIQGIINKSLSLRKGIEWLDQPTVHSVEAGEIYVPTIPYQTDLSVTGRYTYVLTDNELTANIDTLEIDCGILEIHLGSCSITGRMDIEQYLVKTRDFKLKPGSTSYIQYNS